MAVFELLGVLDGGWIGGGSKTLENWQEWQDSNLQPPVLETGALAIELHSCGSGGRNIIGRPPSVIPDRKARFQAGSTTTAEP